MLRVANEEATSVPCVMSGEAVTEPRVASEEAIAGTHMAIMGPCEVSGEIVVGLRVVNGSHL